MALNDYNNTGINKNITLLPKNRTNTIKIERLWVNKQERTVNITNLISDGAIAKKKKRKRNCTDRKQQSMTNQPH